MTETTIPARLVAEGVGLPRVWHGFHGRHAGWAVTVTQHANDAVASGAHIDLTDPQTAFGVALRLDAWEAAGDRYWWADDYLWERRWRDTEALANRVRQIGMDHAIRRSLGERVSPGTLMRLALADDLDTWELALPDGTFFYFGPEGDEGIDRIVSLAGITDPGEALAAIYAEVARDR